MLSSPSKPSFWSKPYSLSILQTHGLYHPEVALLQMQIPGSFAPCSVCSNDACPTSCSAAQGNPSSSHPNTHFFVTGEPHRQILGLSRQKQTDQQEGAVAAFLAQARNHVPQAYALAPGGPMDLIPQPISLASSPLPLHLPLTATTIIIIITITASSY